MTAANIVTDTSTLINFLKIDGAHLLGAHPSTFIATSQVNREIRYQEHRPRLLAAIGEGHLVSHWTGDLAKDTVFLSLVDDVRLGEGESSAIAVAVKKSWLLATDDKEAIRYAQENFPITVITTWDVFRELVTAGVLTGREARDLYAKCGMR